MNPLEGCYIKVLHAHEELKGMLQIVVHESTFYINVTNRHSQDMLNALE